MRSVGLDLGVRHIAFCEVRDGNVVDRTSVRSLSALASRIGPNTPAARVGFEACREGWHVHDKLKEWGHEPHMLDTTRVRQIGVGQHRRKNDAIDAETIALAIESGRVPEAYVLSPERRALRAELSVRGALVETRSQYVTTIRGLARAAGAAIPSCATEAFCGKVEMTPLEPATRVLIAPLLTALRTLETELVAVERKLSAIAQRDPDIALCATVPCVGLIIAATFVSVIDDAKRFRNAHAVGAYLGLVPSEATTGGPSRRRLGGITKQGNTMARVMLIQASWLILRSKDLDDPLHRWADNLAQTRGKRIAVVALARKLSGVLWAMWRDRTVYDSATNATESAVGVHRSARRQICRAERLEYAAKKLRRRDAKAASKTSEVRM